MKKRVRAIGGKDASLEEVKIRRRESLGLRKYEVGDEKWTKIDLLAELGFIITCRIGYARIGRIDARSFNAIRSNEIRNIV